MINAKSTNLNSTSNSKYKVLDFKNFLDPIIYNLNTMKNSSDSQIYKMLEVCLGFLQKNPIIKKSFEKIISFAKSDLSILEIKHVGGMRKKSQKNIKGGALHGRRVGGGGNDNDNTFYNLLAQLIVFIIYHIYIVYFQEKRGRYRPPKTYEERMFIKSKELSRRNKNK